MGLTFVVSHLSFNHSGALPIFLLCIALSFFFLSYVPPIDVTICIRSARIHENKHEREEDQRKICLWRRHQHIKGAKVIGGGELSGNQPVAQHIKERASNDQEKLPPADLERRDQNFHVGNDHQSCKHKVARHINAAMLAVVIWTKTFKSLVS